MGRNNTGLDISKIERYTIDGGAVYKSTGYISKSKTDRNNYTPDEIKIMGQMVIEGVYNYRTAMSRLLRESVKGTTILNEGTYQLLWRVRQEKGTIGVKHWMNHVKPLEYYLETPSSVLFKEINRDKI